MKVARSVSLDVEVLQAIDHAAKLRRVSLSNWVEEACRERLERENPRLLKGSYAAQTMTQTLRAAEDSPAQRERDIGEEEMPLPDFPPSPPSRS